MTNTLPKPPPMRRGDGGYEELGNSERSNQMNHGKEAIIELFKQTAITFIIVSGIVITLEALGVSVR